MKAIIYETYGSPENLKLKEVNRPEPKADEVLVKVLAASVNQADGHLLSGTPFPVRFSSGLFRPKHQILGADISGVIERVGKDVTQFQVGDQIFGDLSGSGFGGFAEYAVAKEGVLAKKPKNLTFEEAAAMPMASVTALQGLRDLGKIKKGDEILINGASGGVGSFAIQIAKALGAKVTAVCSRRNADLAKTLGADEVIDYAVRNFTQEDRKFDLILDGPVNHSLNQIEPVLKGGGRYVAFGFSMEALMLGSWKSYRTGKKFATLMAKVKKDDLVLLATLADEGKIYPPIQQNFTLDEVPEALSLMKKGKISGKLVITI
ncbi:NAD(P)-dependent alcohol dehydrogenase [Algoriphagus yeomjeoni]|uniref:NADPH:quinone reductase-like Zn-dependent oxidoreductase n=1 Tax=Algoriphagus yeomjeoni TaxID=291403 RepID=A0A327PIH1_9BACT|nr:NAD(P)-dependent alcohol dehydrogenase [Algoriphagus yeomjeoni]RAI92100.1 NADPH:quinone reductase-like Zn-dependent oxidoreductase [Algoriphagus yeomjeoni]